MQTRPGRTDALIAAIQCVFLAVCLYVFLQGWSRDFRVPVSFAVDSLVALMQSKSTVDNGWWWFNPRLGAPIGLDELAFPANNNVDQGIVWLASRAVHNPLAAINVAWGLMVVLSGLIATWCLRRLGVSTIGSFVAGCLFALTPYALYRNISHLWMVTYIVPFAASLAILLASGPTSELKWTRRPEFVPLLGSGLLGFNYVYYAFFACFFIVVASFAGYFVRREARVLRLGAFAIALIGACTLLNLAPSLRSWSRHGAPVIVRQKAPAEAEVYGLKIRQLVSPVFDEKFPPLRWWAEQDRDAHFPLETENMISRLGLIATVGFLGLLGLLFAVGAAKQHELGRRLLSASQLTIAGVLLGTIGGFGSLVSLLVTPEIRAYNRITPFLAFFSLFGVAVMMDALFKTRRRRFVAATVVLVVGLADQRWAAEGMNQSYAAAASELPRIDSFVRQLEARLPDQAMVFQLPLRIYLNETGVDRMQPYDHVKLYLVSRRLRWSYPALTNDQVRWQVTAARLDPRRLPYHLAADGFAAIVVDRYAYADNGAGVAAALQEGLTASDVIAATERYVAFDIRHLSHASVQSVSTLASSWGPVTSTMRPCGGQALASFDQVGSTRAPFSSLPIRVSGARPLRVSGWAVDQAHGAVAGGVDVLLDRTAFPTFYGSDRDDVSQSFRNPSFLESGFAADLPVDALPKGRYVLSLRVLSSKDACYYQTPGNEVEIE